MLLATLVIAELALDEGGGCVETTDVEVGGAVVETIIVLEMGWLVIRYVDDSVMGTVMVVDTLGAVVDSVRTEVNRLVLWTLEVAACVDV